MLLFFPFYTTILDKFYQVLYFWGANTLYILTLKTNHKKEDILIDDESGTCHF